MAGFLVFWRNVVSTVAVPVTFLVVSNSRATSANQKLTEAEKRSREIIDEAIKDAEAKKREGMLELKEESIRQKLQQIDLPCLRVFENEFLSSYGATLDDMTEEKE